MIIYNFEFINNSIILIAAGGGGELPISGWGVGVEIVAGEFSPVPPSLTETLVIWDINLDSAC